MSHIATYKTSSGFEANSYQPVQIYEQSDLLEIGTITATGFI